MHRYQRTICAIEHKQNAPIVRGELVIDRGFAQDFINWCSDDAPGKVSSDTDLLLACSRLLKLDLVCIPAEETAGYDAILVPPANHIRQFVNEGLFVFWLVDGAFQSSMTDRGMTALMIGLAQSPGEVACELQQRSQQVMADMDRGVEAGAHGILIADDVAYRQGTYMSPELVERYLLPVWRSQVTAAHRLGVPVFFHSDGNLNAILPYIVNAGFDGLQCLEPAAGMSIRGIKEKYGDALCLMGNIDPALLCAPSHRTSGTTGDDGLRRAVNEVMMAADGRGGLIFGTCSGLHAGMQPEQVRCAYQLAAENDPAARPAIT